MTCCGQDEARGQGHESVLLLLIYGHIQDTWSAAESSESMGRNNTLKPCSSALCLTWKVQVVIKLLSKPKVPGILAPITYAIDYFYESTLQHMNYITKKANSTGIKTPRPR